MSADRRRALARRIELLELEAEVERIALAARLAQLEQQRALTWVTSAGHVLLGTLAALPRFRWLVLAALWRKLARWF